MCLVGMLHYRKHPEEVRKAYPFAAVAKMEGIDFFYFSFDSINFRKKTILAWVYEESEWQQKQMSFPDVIINSSNPRTKKESMILKRLKETILFTSHPVGNKLKVYRNILRGREFSSFMIPSYPLKSGEQVIKLLRDHPRSVIKPVSGNHGKRITFIQKKKSGYELMEGPSLVILKEKEFIAVIDHLLEEQRYFLQPYIECKTKKGLIYDFRLHIQKNGEGKWEITLIYPRISGSAKKVTNISSGGYRGELGPFLREEFGTEAGKVKALLERFSLSFAEHFETLYSHSFDELGIDVGLESPKRLWVFEVNWRPGSRHREFQVARRLIPYCKYLANK